MKIIWCDGFARESVADRLVATIEGNADEAALMLQGLLDAIRWEGDWYRLVDDDYRLSRGMEDLV